LLGIGLALAAAGLWGCGDFAGGLGVRRGHPFAVLLLSALSGIILLGGAFVWRPEPWPVPADVLWALGAGASGSLGLTALYTGLARARVAVVAPTTAVVGATTPVLFGLITQGLVAPQQLSGMAVALLGLWLVTDTTDETSHATGGFGYGIAAGLGTSGFLIAMGQLAQGSVLAPLILARLAGTAVACIALAVVGGHARGLWTNRWAMGAGLLDAAGNLLYVFAVQRVRIDLAAVVSSLYPAVTVLLAARFLHQKVAGRQRLGIVLCLAAVGLISWS
jgi:drug/metabolite transporter (DMT)-like permease